ncbi:ABC transporter permease [Phytoactinopolyspora alkaliphila]|uniref:ABC transporter permease n=1 Tax=Phytoactinopolyspora alkaliphila TaxID=1783498 RepID=A0A6N9YNG1_9ACTN|nr:ABC transporter permease [Phytoactinopolyspora alkaliphila]
MNLLNYAVKRLGFMLATLLGVVTFTFVLVRAAGDPDQVMIGPDLDPSVRETLREAYGLDESLFTQYVKFIGNAATGDLGTSFQYRAPVADVLGEKLVNTLLLLLPALALGMGLGMVLGVLAGAFWGRPLDAVITRFALLVRAAPLFWVATLVLLLFSYTLGWFPSGGMFDPGSGAGESFTARVLSLEFLRRLVLPLGVTVLLIMVWPLLTMRTAMLDVMKQDFMQVLEAAGMSRTRILFRHGARNALLPVVSLMPSMIGFLVGGQVVVETVFSWPGMGRELVASVDAFDYPVLQGGFLLTATVVIVVGVLADIAYAYLDPRVRLT